MTILVVDDHALNRELLRAELAPAGYAVREAADGAAALEMLAREPVDAIISDIRMPRMDGFQLCREMRAREEFATVRFIIYTSSHSPQDEARAFELGADLYLVKPTPEGVLLEALAWLIGKPPVQPPAGAAPAALDAVRQHSEALIRQLEQKNAELAKQVESLTRAERQLQLQHAALETAANAVVITDRRGTILWANPAFGAMTGYPLHEVIGATPRLLKSGRHDAAFYRELWETILGGRTWRGEFTNRRKDGSLYEGEQTITPVRADGEITHFVGVMNDATARKQAEAALERERLLMRTLVDEIPDLIYVKDRESRFMLANKATAGLLGAKSPADLTGRTDIEFHSPERSHEYRSDELRVFGGEPLFDKEEPVTGPDGRQRTFLTTKLPLRDPAGKVTALVGIGREITERKRTEEELRRAKNQFQSIFQNALEGIYQTTPEGTYLAVNPALAQLFGYASPEEMIVQRRDIAHQGYADPETRAEFKRRIETEGVLIGFEYAALRKDGSSIWVSESARVVRGDDGRALFYEGTVQDITPRRQFEHRLKLQHEVTAVLADAGSLAQIYHQLLATIGAGLEAHWGELWLRDRDAGVLRCAEVWHPPSTEFKEFAHVMRRTTFACGEGLPGRVWASARPEWSPDVATDPQCARHEFAERLRLHGWMGFPIRLRNELLGVLGFFSLRVLARDDEKLETLNVIGTQLGQFMERQQLAEQFRLAQKMEAIGTLAGGIAHDFNNIIAGISGYAELATMEFGRDPRITVYLDPILKGARRAAALVRQILAFSRQQEQQRTSLQLRPVVTEAVALLRATIPATIEFDVSLDDELPSVLADATQIHQVLMNLCTNAAHAMRHRPGRLGIKLERCDVDEAMAAGQPGLRAGTYVRLSVSDTGHGMDQATVSRIFEPFFTTKAPGEGTGLGLSVVHGIVQSHDGVTTVSSQPGEGTVFRLYFPATDEQQRAVIADLSDLTRGGGERILYVDDEEPLAWMGGQVLERLGYFVETFTDPTQALASFAADPSRFDLVITDLAMPKMAGTDLAERLLAINPSLPIVLITGFATTHTSGGLRALGIREMILKPLAVQTLASTVRRVLTEPVSE